MLSSTLSGAVSGEVSALDQPQNSAVIISHAIAMHGAPKYAADFPHFDYVNPNAPKRGRIRRGSRGTFDSFNPWIDKGTPVSPASIETLMVHSADEALTSYCLLCERIEYAADRSWITFYLRPEARWHDGKPITAEDVQWSFQTIIDKGQPFYKFYYADVGAVEVLSPRAVRFNFTKAGNRELPIIIGDLPILPKHYWQDRDFSKTTLEPPLGSGAYRIKDFDAGRYYTLELVEDYWGRALAVNQGVNNFKTMRVDFFRDSIPIRLALKAGELDFHAENTAKSWATEFDIAAVQSGWLVRETVKHSAPQGMQAYVMNLRRAKFSDSRVRRAMSLAFDFEWANQKIFHDQYARTTSYFSNSELASSGVPQGRELALLTPYAKQLPPALFTEPFKVATTDGRGWPRDNLLKALGLLQEAGWKVVDGVLVDSDGQAFTVEFLLYSASLQPLILPYVANLRRLGIAMKVRVVDTSQYVNRVREFDFDMIVDGWGQSNTPGNEQREFWSCAAVARAGSRNSAGICHPVVDALIEKIVVAQTREELIALTRAMDRVLLWQYYIVPNWHLPANRILWWDKFARPDVALRNGVDISRWWVDEEKARRLLLARENGEITQSLTETGKSTPAGWKLGLLAVVLLLGIMLMRKSMRGRKSMREKRN